MSLDSRYSTGDVLQHQRLRHRGRSAAGDFAADVGWARTVTQIRRFNLAQQLAFAEIASPRVFWSSAPRRCRWFWWMAKWRWPGVI